MKTILNELKQLALSFAFFGTALIIFLLFVNIFNL